MDGVCVCALSRNSTPHPPGKAIFEAADQRSAMERVRSEAPMQLHVCQRGIHT